MRKFWYIFLLAIPLNAQEVLLEGSVMDSRSKDPIPYVNLSFLNTLKGTSTDEEGKFFIDIPTPYLEKQVHISSLGYKDTIVNAQKLYKEKKIFLVEESFELDEVVVSENFGNADVLNPITSYSLTSGFSSSATPWVVALYFPNIGAQKKYMHTVTVFLKKDINFKRDAAKFRLRMYDVAPGTKKPNKDLLRKSIVLEANMEQEYVSIDLSSLQIKIPKEGIYIGIEWLFVPYNWYKTTSKDPLTNKAVVEDRFAPTFRGVYTKNQNYKAMVYGMGEWTNFSVKSKDMTQNFIPAISLKLLKDH